MWCSIQMLILLVTMLSVATAQSVSEPPGIKGKFSTSNGAVIELDTKTGTLVTPRSRGATLQDCSDKFQVCLTDHHGFAFAYFRKCTDAGLGIISASGFVQKSYPYCTAICGWFSTLPPITCSTIWILRASSESILGRRLHSIFAVFSMTGILRCLASMRRNIALRVLTPLLRAARDPFHRQRTGLRIRPGQLRREVQFVAVR